MVVIGFWMSMCLVKCCTVASWPLVQEMVAFQSRKVKKKINLRYQTKRKGRKKRRIDCSICEDVMLWTDGCASLCSDRTVICCSGHWNTPSEMWRLHLFTFSTNMRCEKQMDLYLHEIKTGLKKALLTWHDKQHIQPSVHPKLELLCLSTITLHSMAVTGSHKEDLITVIKCLVLHKIYLNAVSFIYIYIYINLLRSSCHCSNKLLCTFFIQPDCPISLSIADRDLIKKLCRLLAHYRALFKVSTCQSWVLASGLSQPWFYWWKCIRCFSAGYPALLDININYWCYFFYWCMEITWFVVLLTLLWWFR